MPVVICFSDCGPTNTFSLKELLALVKVCGFLGVAYTYLNRYADPVLPWNAFRNKVSITRFTLDTS